MSEPVAAPPSPPSPAPAPAPSTALPSPRLAPPPPKQVVRHGLALGILGEWLLHEGPGGVGLALWLGALALSARLLAPTPLDADGPRAGERPALAFLALAALLLAVRDAPGVRLALVAGSAGGWVVLAALRGHGRSHGASGRLVDGAASLARGVVIGGRRAASEAAPGGAWVARGRARLAFALRTALVGLPLLAVLTALFRSADPVFARWVDGVVATAGRVDGARVALAAVLAWGATGLLRETGGAAAPVRVPLPGPPRALAGELLAVTALVDGLFLAFVASQADALFGGAARVAAVDGLTWAGYARRGFFELVAAAALVLPLAVVTEASLDPGDDAARRRFRALAGALAGLTALVLASAVYRLGLYAHVYGLTRLRVYVFAFLVWTAALLGWMVPTLLGSRRRAFVPGAVALAAAVLVGLAAANPDARVAAANLARVGEAGASPGPRPAFDAAYAASLGGDAVPVLLEGMGALPPPTREELARRLLARWDEGEEAPRWRGSSLAAVRARTAVAARRDRLQAWARGAGG